MFLVSVMCTCIRGNRDSQFQLIIIHHVEKNKQSIALHLVACSLAGKLINDSVFSIIGLGTDELGGVHVILFLKHHPPPKKRGDITV